MVKLCLVIASALLGFVSASRVVLESVDVPSRWQTSNARDLEPVTLRISLKHQDPGKLQELLHAVSTPGHSQYGRHMNRDELNSLLSPPAATIDAVKEWLETAGVESIEVGVGQDYIILRTNVAAANKLLHARFQWFMYKDGEDIRLRTLQYSVPKTIARYISFIHPTTDFSSAGEVGLRSRRSTTVSISRRASNITIDSDCKYGYTIECVRNALNVDYNFTNIDMAGKVAFSSFYDYSAIQADLQTFEELFLPQALGQTFKSYEINGGVDDQNNPLRIEANGDVQTLLGMSFPLPIEQFIVGGRGGGRLPQYNEPGVGSGVANGTGTPWLEYLDYLLALPNHELPHTISNSYGDTEQSYPEPLAKEICNLMGRLGARGVSFFVSAGDEGVGKYCSKNDLNGTQHYTQRFPSTCPYVASVGGVYGFSPSQSTYHAGSGFSDIFPRPTYQNPIVPDYLYALNDSNRIYYNQSGRAYPDLAGPYANIYTVNDGAVQYFAGTSASAPIVGGIFGLLNGALLERGLTPMGFINPWLYKEGFEALDDVVSGESVAGCESTLVTVPNSVRIPNAGFKAQPGWDAATGFGTPNFPKMLKLVLSSRGIY